MKAIFLTLGALTATVSSTSASCPGRTFLNPVESEDLGFSDYVRSYSCSRDDDCIDLAPLVGASNFCNLYNHLCQARDIPFGGDCASDSDCGADQFCGQYGDCQSINFLLKYKSVSLPTVILPGQERTVRFKVEDHTTATVPNTAELDLVFYGGEPARTVVTRGANPQDTGSGLVLDQVSEADQDACAFPRRADPRSADSEYNPLYWRVHYDYISGVENDNMVAGTWEFKIRNTNLYEPIVYTGGFLTMQVRYD